MQVLRMKPYEQVVLDQDRLTALYRDMGPSAAEDVVCRTMEELAIRLSRSERHYQANDLTAMRKDTRALVAISEQIGLFSLAMVADDVTTCLDMKDDIALAATLSRLLRIGEQSLTAVWDLHDIPI